MIQSWVIFVHIERMFIGHSAKGEKKGGLEEMCLRPKIMHDVKVGRRVEG